MAQKLSVAPPPIDPGETVAIGSIDASLLEMVRAWTAFLKGGLVEPYGIEEITDSPEKSQAPETQEFQEGKEIFDEKTRLAILRGMRAAIEYVHEYPCMTKDGSEKICKKYVGTGKLALWGDTERNIPKLDFPIMGKTGTATDNAGETTDNWFVGCTPSYCMGVWIGRDKKLPMKSTPKLDNEGNPVIGTGGKELKVQETGGLNALPIFIKTMYRVYENQPKELFPEATDPNKPFTYRTPDEQSHPPSVETQETAEIGGNDF